MVYPWFSMAQHGSLFCSFTSHPVGTSCSHRPGSGASRVCVDESTSILKVMTIAPAPMAWCEQCDICCRSWGKRTQKWEATYHNWNGCSSVKFKHLNFNISVQDVCSIYLNILDTCFGHTKPKKRNEFQILILPLPAVWLQCRMAAHYTWVLMECGGGTFDTLTHRSQLFNSRSCGNLWNDIRSRRPAWWASCWTPSTRFVRSRCARGGWAARRRFRGHSVQMVDHYNTLHSSPLWTGQWQTEELEKTKMRKLCSGEMRKKGGHNCGCEKSICRYDATGTCSQSRTCYQSRHVHWKTPESHVEEVFGRPHDTFIPTKPLLELAGQDCPQPQSEPRKPQGPVQQTATACNSMQQHASWKWHRKRLRGRGNSVVSNLDAGASPWGRWSSLAETCFDASTVVRRCELCTAAMILAFELRKRQRLGKRQALSLSCQNATHRHHQRSSEKAQLDIQKIPKAWKILWQAYAWMDSGDEGDDASEGQRSIAIAMDSRRWQCLLWQCCGILSYCMHIL